MSNPKKYEDQPFVWTEELTSDDLREMMLVRLYRVARERWDCGKDPRPLDTIGELEANAIDEFHRAFELRMKRAKALVEMGHGVEVPRQ